MLDEFGETVWIYRRANFGAAHVLPNGNLMYMRRGGSDRSFYEITPFGDLVNRAPSATKATRRITTLWRWTTGGYCT